MRQADMLPDDLPEDILDHLDDPEVTQRWPRDLVAMLEVIANALDRDGDDQARRHATIAARALGQYHGGRMYYLPTGEALDRALRDKSMWDSYHGRRDEVIQFCEQYGLTEQQVYKILREQRALHVKRVQRSLPLDD